MNKLYALTVTVLVALGTTAIAHAVVDFQAKLRMLDQMVVAVDKI